MAVYRPEVAVVVSPFVPDVDAVVGEVFDVRVAGDEPEELVDDSLEKHLLRGDKGEPLGEVEAQLPSEDGAGAGAGAVPAVGAVVQDVLEEVEVGLHIISFCRYIQLAPGKDPRAKKEL